MALKLHKFEFPLPKNTLKFVSWLIEIGLAVLEEIFKSCLYIFNLLLLSPLRKRARSFIWKKLNPLNSRMFCAKFGWNWPSSSGEEVVNVFLLCSYYLPLTKGTALHLNKIESSLMLYVKFGGTWLGDSEDVNMCKDMDGHWTDRQIKW